MITLMRAAAVRYTSHGAQQARRFATSSDRIRDLWAVRELLEHRHHSTCYLFDIDNVLMRSVTQFGSDAMSSWLNARAVERDEPTQEALNRWHAIQMFTRVCPVEIDTVPVFQRIQQTCPTFAVTARSHAIATRTFDQLSSIGVHLHQKLRPFESRFWPNGFSTHSFEHALFDRSILFSAGHCKGAGVSELFAHTTLVPKHVVYIDDRRTHVASVIAACNALGIECIGYHYRFTEEWVASFCPAAAEKQLQHILEVARR